MTSVSSVGAAKKIPTLAGTRREKGKCRVFNLSCTELPPLNACRGVSLGGCLCEFMISVSGEGGSL